MKDLNPKLKVGILKGLSKKFKLDNPVKVQDQRKLNPDSKEKTRYSMDKLFKKLK